MKQEPGYYANIPAPVRYDERLIPRAILLYGEITALTNKHGYCWASDKYFAEVYHVDKRNIQRWLNSLEECGYIKRVVEYDGKKIVNRKIYLLTKTSLGVMTKTSYPTDENVVPPTDENVRENNTSINTTDNNTNNTLSSSAERDKIPYSEIIGYLNKKANAKYRTTTAKTKTLIKARWKEGNRVDDFKAVIDNKVADWLGKEQEMYLRPETLFGTKFEGYLNQRNGSTAKQKKHQDITDVYGF